MSPLMAHTEKAPSGGKHTALWMALIGVVLLAVIFLLATIIKPEHAVQIQAAPWQTLLFIDNTTINL